jgi:sugar phosphate isomerase/epimerase
MIRLGVSLVSLNWPFRRAIEEAARMAAAGVHFDAEGDLSPDRLSQSGRREIRALMRSLNLEIAAVGCPLRRGLDVATDLQPRIERVKKIMSLSHDLGARITVVDMPPIPQDQPEEPALPQLSAGGLLLGRMPRREQPSVCLREALTDLGAYGDRIGVMLALNAGIDTPDELTDYLATFNTGALQVNFDAASYLSHGHDPLLALAKLSSRTVHVHAREVRRGASGQYVEVPLGAGDLDWMSFTAVLDATGYRGFITVKRTDGTNPINDLRQGLELLRRFVRSRE